MDNIYFLGNEKYTKKIFINNGRLFSQNILQENAISPMENIDYILLATQSVLIMNTKQIL